MMQFVHDFYDTKWELTRQIIKLSTKFGGVNNSKLLAYSITYPAPEVFLSYQINMTD